VLESYEQTPEVITVLVDPVVHLLDMRLLKEADHLLLQLSAALAGDDLHHWNTLVHRFFHQLVQGTIDVAPLVIDVVQVEFELCHGSDQYIGQFCGIPVEDGLGEGAKGDDPQPMGPREFHTGHHQFTPHTFAF
jgi:hypothetical protein